MPPVLDHRAGVCSAGQPAFPLPVAFEDGYEVDVCPNGTKAKPGERAIRPVLFKYQASRPARYQYLCRVREHVRLCQAEQEAHPDARVRAKGDGGAGFAGGDGLVCCMWWLALPV